ncbi:protein trichome birefringence-like 11 isoform X2 [Gossypium raimondii]|uniref:Uncharacterized protein n=1 Tax=Gossypium raimondii TaxID=29730 RepID=A0A0D2TEH3_GOSRA|nr:protein trichome birefringence-like 11 isoform X2 [Gossypium raimondii]KJB42085.1 hypothetical protein B456_007G135900 [Gossypium raimondii]
MTKNTTSQDLSKTTTHLDFSKKSKNFSPLEPFLGVLGFTLVTCLFIGAFFYLDYRAVLHPGFSLFGRSGTTTPSSLPSEAKAAIAKAPAKGNGRLGFLNGGGVTCDIYDGKWVWDDNYPLYQSQDCPFADSGFRCLENGRPDSYYTKWRWQPHDCDLPRFNATMMLEKLRNRRLAFIGDSIGRNQWESMLCLLATAIPNKDSIYEGSPPKGSPKDVRMTLKLDHVTWTHRQWKDADVLVFNSGHWWSYAKTIKHGCYFQEGMEVKMKMDLTNAFQKSIETLVDFVASQVDTKKTQVMLRTYAPVHFRGGTWNTGGHCHQLKLPDFGPLPNNTGKLVDIVSGVLSKHPQGFQVIKLMNVTPMTYQRQDGHTSLYHFGPGNGPGPMNRQDCSHWCLPGVPDTWNELVYALFLQREYSRS